MKQDIENYKAKLFRLNAQLYSVQQIIQRKREISDPENAVEIEQKLIKKINHYTQLLNKAQLAK